VGGKGGEGKATGEESVLVITRKPSGRKKKGGRASSKVRGRERKGRGKTLGALRFFTRKKKGADYFLDTKEKKKGRKRARHCFGPKGPALPFDPHKKKKNSAGKPAIPKRGKKEERGEKQACA